MSRPLSPTTFLTRNAMKTLPLVAVITLAVMLILSIVALMNSIPLSIRTIYGYSARLLAITPRGDPARIPNIVEKVKQESPSQIEKIILCRASMAQVNSIVGKWDFVVLGMKPEDLRYYAARMKTKSVTGRYPEAGKPEILISRPVAANLKLKIGDTMLGPDTQDMYSPQPVKLVGIAETDYWFIANDFTYQEANHFPPIDNVLAFASDPAAGQAKLDAWALEAFKGERAYVFTFADLEKQTNAMFKILYGILNVVIYTLVIVITFMMGMLMNIYQSQRLQEFGLLQAIGFTKRQLLSRVLRETGLVLIFGWALGLVAGVGMLMLVKTQMFDKSAFALDPYDPVAMRYTIPAPIAIALVAGLTVWLRFRKFDPVGIVERRLV